MDESSIIFLVILLLLAIGALLICGGIAFFLVLALRKRVLRLEADLKGALGAAFSGGGPPPAPAAAREPARPVSPIAQPVVPPARPPSFEAVPPEAQKIAAAIAAREKAPGPPPAPPPAPPQALPPAPPPPKPPAGLESIERLLGTRWLNWIGACVTLVGVAFLLKFLYDLGWIGPAGRVGIGLGFGLSLLAVGELKLRKIHDLLSQAVSSAGIGSLFLTTYLAFKFYEFSGRLATFAFLTWFAAFAVALAVLRRGKILAVLGLICAYATPYLLSTGQDQAEALFSYLAIIALAGAAVRVARDWYGITPLCFAFSLIYYASWHQRFYAPDRLSIAAVGALGLIFFFALSALARGLWHRRETWIADVSIFAVAEICGMYFLWTTLFGEHKAALCYSLLGISLFDIGAFWAVRLRRAASPILDNALLLMAAGSLVLVIPAALKTEGAVVAWSLAAVILADMGIRSRRLLLEIAAGACLFVAILAGFVQEVAHTGAFRPIANAVFAAWFAVALAWFLSGRRWAAAQPASPERRVLGAILQIISSAIFLILLTYETASWFAGELRLPGADVLALKDRRTVELFVLWAIYPWLWLWRADRYPKLWILGAAFYAVLGIALLTQLPELHHREIILFLNPSFAAAVLLPVGLFVVSRKVDLGGNAGRTSLQLYAHFLLVVILSVEISTGLSLSDWAPASQRWIRMAFVSVGWALYATVLIVWGIRRSLASWRWFALALLGATLIKVILVDMATIRQIWRVLSFMVLGALLMGCSYAYVRFEKRKNLEIEKK